MFLEPQGPDDAALSDFENYSDPTGVWTRIGRRMYPANGTWQSNWLTAVPIGMTIGPNHAAEILTPVINAQSNLLLVRSNQAAQTGYAIQTDVADDGIHLKIIISRRDGVGQNTVIASSAAFLSAPGYSGNNWLKYYLRVVPNGSSIHAEARYYDNPTVVQASVTVTDTTYATGDINVGARFANQFFSNLAIWDNTTETLDITPDTQVVGVGDSRVAATNVTQFFEGWVDRAIDWLGRKYIVRNKGVSGYTIQDVIDHASEVDALYDATLARNIIVGQVATNTLNLVDGNGRASLDLLWSYYAARKAVGWKEVCIPETPRSISGTALFFEANRTVFNAGQRDEWPAHTNRRANVLSAAEIGGAGAESNATYYPDELHWSSPAYIIVVPIIAAQVQDIRNADLDADAGFGFTTFVFTFKKNGVAEPLTSAYLSDRDGVFGVKRLDTGEVVIPAGRPLTQTTIDGTPVDGSYYITFANPAEGLTYLAVERAVHGGNTFFVPKETTDTVDNSPPTADGYYVKRAKVINTAGQDNFDIGFNLDSNATVADEAIAQEVFDDVDGFVDQCANEAGIKPDSAATSPHFIATSHPAFPWLNRWSSRLARAEGSLLRGVMGSEDSAKAEGQMTNMRDEAIAEIRKIMSQIVNGGWVFDGIKVVGSEHCPPCGIEVW